MYQEKINNYEQSAKNESDLGFDSERLSYIPKYFSSYIDKGKSVDIVRNQKSWGKIRFQNKSYLEIYTIKGSKYYKLNFKWLSRINN